MPKIYGNTTATPFATGKMVDVVGEALMNPKELYNFIPSWFQVGTQNEITHYGANNCPIINLEAYKTYIISVVTPKIGESVELSGIGTLYYEGDRYTGKVKLYNHITTFSNVHFLFNLSSPDNDLRETAKIVIEEESLIKKEITELKNFTKSLESHIVRVDDRVEYAISWLNQVDSNVYDLNETVGNIDSALDNILSIQQNLIGGGN